MCMLYCCVKLLMNQLNINEIDIPGYDKYVNFRQNKRGGGVVVYINIGLQHTLRSDLTINCNDIFESCFVELKMNKTPIIIDDIIVHPTQMNKHSFMNITLY